MEINTKKVTNETLKRHLKEYQKTDIITNDFGRELMKLATIIVKNEDNSNNEDIKSDIVLKIMESLPNVDPDQPVFNYFYTIGRNCIKIHYKSLTNDKNKINNYNEFINEGDCGKKITVFKEH